MEDTDPMMILQGHVGANMILKCIELMSSPVLQIDPRTTLPIRSILFTMLTSTLLSLVVFGSSTAFNDLVGLTVAALNSSYLLASGLLLY